MQTINLPPNPRILIIRRDNIGDLVCTTPAIAALKSHYPNASIGVLTNSYNADVLLGNPDVDNQYIYQKLKHVAGITNVAKAVAKRLDLIIKLRKWGPQVVILAKSSYDRHALNFARQINGKNIIGFVPNQPNKSKRLPDIQLPTPESDALHEVEAVKILLEPLGIKGALGPLRVFPIPKVVNDLKKKLKISNDTIAVHISAREIERQWGIDNFTMLVEYILKSYPSRYIMLLWSPGGGENPEHPGDDAAASKLIGSIKSDRLIPMATKNLGELIAALSLCDCFIGCDGGAMHIAAALNKKVVAMFENTSHKLTHWHPWKTVYEVVHSQVEGLPNVSSITQVQVRQSLNRLLG